MPNGGDSTEEQWMLESSERELVMTKHRANRLGFAILLTFFRERGRFPRDESEIEVQEIAALSKQLDVPTPVDGETFLTGRTAERLRAEIRVRFGFRGATDFVFFARRGERVSNRREDHEISMLALHLIQNGMVYSNTLMI